MCHLFRIVMWLLIDRAVRFEMADWLPLPFRAPIPSAASKYKRCGSAYLVLLVKNVYRLKYTNFKCVIIFLVYQLFLYLKKIFFFLEFLFEANFSLFEV